jgi:hypothetical protein
MSQLRQVEGTVLILCCEGCKKTFPHFRFMGETDADTIGLGSATCCEKNEVLIAEMIPAEWSTQDRGGLLEFERRLSHELRRTDIRVVQLLHVDEQEKVGAGISFKEFREKHAPLVLTFSCACCTEGKSTQITEMTVEEFRDSGGLVSVVGALSL